MKKLFVLMISLMVLGTAVAQTGDPLPPQLLSREKVYTNLEEALANPEAVYKLDLSEQGLKALPPEIEQLENLQRLNLSKNKLKELPVEIGNLQNLQSLNLYNNKLKVLPKEVQNLKNLTELFLAYNRIYEVPMWFGGLGKLRTLDLSYTRVTPYEVDRISWKLHPDCNITY